MQITNMPDKPFTLPELFAYWGLDPKKRTAQVSAQLRRDLLRYGYMYKHKKVNGRVCTVWERRG